MTKTLKPHHLENLPTPVAEALTDLFKLRLSDDVHQQAAAEILEGKPTEIAVRHARAQAKRDLRNSAWVSLDGATGAMLSLLECLAAPEPEEIESWRGPVNAETEKLVEQVEGGTNCLAQRLGVTRSSWSKSGLIVEAKTICLGEGSHERHEK
jgi:hypothetical protein